ncbi:MAG TPA: hypothetical protein VFW11_16015 [Cyclobacteriaceae bacterium]|nr:hypothetical protein [Cyclobacteriaceae bacterium]
MKNYTIIHILLFLLFMLAYQCSHAQSDYLVTTRGDTVRGELKLLFYGPEKKVQVKTDKDKTTYSILNTKSFFYEGEYYRPAKGPEGYLFMKVIKPGYLSILAYQVDKSSSYDGRYLMRADGQGIEVPNIGFKKQMSRFLSDCESVSLKIEQDTYNKRDLEQIVDEYNLCIDKKTAQTNQAISQEKEKGTKANSWDVLVEKINQHADFEGKETALEMTADIKNRLQRGEKIPAFVVDGLKNTLAEQTELKEALQIALTEIGY